MRVRRAHRRQLNKQRGQFIMNMTAVQTVTSCGISSERAATAAHNRPAHATHSKLETGIKLSNTPGKCPSYPRTHRRRLSRCCPEPTSAPGITPESALCFEAVKYLANITASGYPSTASDLHVLNSDADIGPTCRRMRQGSGGVVGTCLLPQIREKIFFRHLLCKIRSFFSGKNRVG